MPLLNLTPHEVTVFDAQHRVIRRYPATEHPVRVSVSRIHVGHIDGGVPLVSDDYGRAALPERTPGTWYIVSARVAMAHPERDDLLVPTDLVRSADGAVIGCRALDCRAAARRCSLERGEEGTAADRAEP